MPSCPVCFGDGSIDCRGADALARVYGLDLPILGVQTCDECEGTGVVTAERQREIVAWTVATVDQFFAAYPRTQTAPGRGGRGSARISLLGRDENRLADDGDGASVL